jgi:hypothetical protein
MKPVVDAIHSVAQAIVAPCRIFMVCVLQQSRDVEHTSLLSIRKCCCPVVVACENQPPQYK